MTRHGRERESRPAAGGRPRRGRRWALAAAAGVFASLALLPSQATSDHEEAPAEDHEWVATPGAYTEKRLPLDGIHYDWWRCDRPSGCVHGYSSFPAGERRSLLCPIPGGSGRVGLGHCGALLGGLEDMCPIGDYGDCFGEHVQGGGWVQVLGPGNPKPGEYDPSLCTAAQSQADVGALTPPTPGHYDCWPVKGTWLHKPYCGSKPQRLRGVAHCGYWRSLDPGPTTTAPAPTSTVPAPTTTAPAPTSTVPAPTTTAPAATTTVPAPTTTVPAPPPGNCGRQGFVYFPEFGGCRPERCPSGYVRSPANGWCEPRPLPPDTKDTCKRLYGQHDPRCYSNRPLNLPPKWLTDHDGDPLRATKSQEITQRLGHLVGVSPLRDPYWLGQGFDWNPDNRCDGADELNVYPPSVGVGYDCLRVQVRVQAVVPGTGRWTFKSPECGNTTPGLTLPRRCRSDSATWKRSHWLGGTGNPPSADTGQWSVRVGALDALSRHEVAVPFTVSVDDWGDVSHLVITATARDFWGWRGYGNSRSDTISFKVPRRSGPAPAADAIELSVAETASRAKKSRFVEVLREQLLANDACPSGVDCTDPLSWPVWIDDERAQRCVTGPFDPGARPLTPTAQGMVGCDELNDVGDPSDPASVRYWPRLWASGHDRFAYTTYGGSATVTVRFTDSPPAVSDLEVRDRGETHAAARLRHVRHRYSHSRPQVLLVSYEVVPGTEFATENRWHHGTVEIVADDPDGDFRSLRLVSVAESENEVLRGAVELGPRYVNLYRSGYVGSAATPASTSALDPASGTWRNLGVYGNRCVSGDTTVWSTLGPGIHYSAWTWRGAPGACRPPQHECGPGLSYSTLCWATWSRDDGAGTTVAVRYRACDARYDAIATDWSAYSEYLAGRLGHRYPHIAPLLLVKAVGRTRLKWRPPQVSPADWKQIQADVEGHVDSRQCSAAAVTLQLGACVWSLSDEQRDQLAAELSWHTLVGLQPVGAPGQTWPPHPETPGGHDHLVVAQSPVWPRIDDPAALDFTDDAGCAWNAEWVQTKAAQMLPWNPAHRAEAGADADDRFEAWLRMWDGLNAAARAEAAGLHTDLDFDSVRCPTDAAADGTAPVEHNSSYRQCRWTLPRPGLWRWQVLAEFTGADSGQRARAVLAEGLTWFRSFHAYTAQRTFTRFGPGQD